MKVLFLNSIDRDVFGGVENWIGLIADGLTARGHSVSVIGRPESEFLRRTRMTCAKANAIELNISGDFNPMTIARIKSILERDRIELLIANFNKDIRLGSLAARWNGSTKVVWRAGLDLTKDSFFHRNFTARFLDGVITPSQALKKQITQKGHIPERIVEVIPNGIAEKKMSCARPDARAQLRRRYRLPDDCRVAVTSGRFVDQKGHIYLVEAAAEIVKRVANVYFLLLGNGPLEQMLRAKIAEAGLRENFVFAGLRDDFELELDGADIMLHPSVEEPFGQVLVEGMQAGLPIVASRVGGIPEVVEEGRTAVLVESRRADILARAAVDLLNNPDRLRNLGTGGRDRWDRQFRSETMVDRVEAYFRRVIAGNAENG